jgi:hypothetical protein
MKVIVSEDVLMALKALVEWSRSYDPDDYARFTKDIPLIAEWLEEVGAMPRPADAEQAS